MMSYFTKIMVFSLLCLIAAISKSGADTIADLQHKLTIIDGSRDGTQTRAQKLEQECLGLLKDVHTTEDSGLIYAELAFIFSRSGIIQPEKLISYCKLALQFPLADTLTAPLFGYWAYGLQRLYDDSLFKADKSNLRIEIARICMNGLKQIMLHDLSQATQDLPLVPLFDYIGSKDNPRYQELLREYEEALARRVEIFKQQDLVMYRNALIDKLAYLIKLDSGMKGKIEQLAQSTLANKDEVKEVLSLIDKKLSSK
jgi:hypothetical protein